MNDRRALERFSLEMKAVLFTESDKGDQKGIDVLTRDVCADGIFLQTRKTFSVGTRVNLEMLLLFGEKTSQAKDSMLRISGKVIRCEEAGMALQFNEEYRISPLPDRLLQ